MENVIVKGSDFQIFWNQTMSSGVNKALRITVKAVNPVDGLTYEKYAGWISSTLAVHGGSNTPAYVLEKAIESVGSLGADLVPAVVAHLESIGQTYRANEYRQHAASAAGRGVSDSVAHPQRNF